MEHTPVALVTGSRTGIGLFLAQELVAAGYRVVGCSRSPAAWTSERYSHICADVSDEQQVRAMVAQIRREFGRLDVVVNNAGIASMNHVLVTPASTIDRIMATNVRGAFVVSRESAKLMRKRGFGRIVNFSTVAVPLSLAGEAAYVASKSALEGLTRVMSRELAEFGITVNAVGPGPVETALTGSIPKESIQKLVGQLATKRMCRLEDVAHVVKFLIAPASDGITGQVIYLGGA